ncbi:hypothetical protein NDN08_008342 [Rhodosorus marinus]|uniref:UBC core domain-containing protein n=1 Tax=Rhodosorus marinus TaxID=101924 RepID=A0AAV8V2Y4_9RHOD|nr:hypothetical protein NDN08_008342 [Rhodosorus marinus]
MAKVKPSGALKRIMQEVMEMEAEMEKPNCMFAAKPLETDVFEWHFSIKGPESTSFEGGVYHGRILLPAEYPFKPPEIIMLTPNGRFECGARICLSVTSFHNETWQPSWGIRTILTALIAFMPTNSTGLGALQYPDDHRRQLAKASARWKCSACGTHPFGDIMKNVVVETGGSSETTAQTEPSTEVETVAVVEESAAGGEDATRAVEGENEREAEEYPAQTLGQTTVEAPVPSAVPGPRPEPPQIPELHVGDVQAVGEGQHIHAVVAPATVELADKETKLLYLAYALVFAIIAIMARRAFILAGVSMN